MAALALLPVLAACGVRLETPAPTEPAPDALEQARARTVDAALELAQAATSAREAVTQGTEPSADPTSLTLVLDDVAAYSVQHAQQLGGTYDSGLPGPTPTPTSTPTSAPTSTTASSGEVLALLADAAATALDDAATVQDGPLARLVASVGAARTDLAQRLATATGQPVPEGISQVPASTTGGATAPTSSAAPTSAASQSPGAASDAPGGLASDDLDALVLAEDQAGYGYEVLAAVLGDDQRDDARAAAADHRERAEQWAVLAGTTGTSADPRRVAYTVPTGLTDPAVAAELARTLPQTLTDTYGSMIARADAGTRGTLLDGLLRSTAEAHAWGAAPVAFPGMPELAVAG
ncbi:DUF4439 domain-containing protein [Cellulomonas soli]